MPADVSSWLSEFRRLSAIPCEGDSGASAAASAAIREFAERSRADAGLFDSLELCLDTCQDHASVEPVCSQLFQFYRHGDPELRRFTVELVPCLIGTYLRAVHHRQWLALAGESESATAEAAWVSWYDLIESLVAGLYNLSVAEPPTDQLTSVPSLARPCIYHASGTQPGQRSWARLRQWPRRPVGRVHHENRQAVLAQLMSVYNDRLFQLSDRSVRSCLTAARRLSDLGGPGRQRLAVDQALLMQCVRAAYSVMFTRRGVPAPGVEGGGSLDQLAAQALLQLRARAEYELYSDVLLLVNAMLNPVNKSGGCEAGPFGIAVTPQQPLDASVSKQAVTNASFRIRHLPEDITMATKQQRRPADAQSEEPGAKAAAAAAVADVVIHLIDASDDDADVRVRVLETEEF